MTGIWDERVAQRPKVAGGDAHVLAGRRRPSGEPPALPRPISPSTRAYLGATVAVGGLWMSLQAASVSRAVTRLDLAVLGALETLRADPITALMEQLQALGAPWILRILGWATLVLLLAFRRFQRLFAFLVIALVVTSVNTAMAVELGRMRPSGVVAGGWSGYSHPSIPVAGLAFGVVAALYTLVPPGRPRFRLAWAGAVPVGMLVAARLYLGVDHPTDVVAGLVTGGAFPIAAFRLFTPDEVFPLTYRRGHVRAHLDVGGRRGEAIVTALRRQLGVAVVSATPFALEGSAGSTPLRFRIVDADGAERQLFGKLYAVSHLRSDRWYKLARTVLYGRLEDEKPFNTVRRVVEYEDHLLRVMRDAGLPVPEPYGFVEITPEREYLIVMEFLDGACRVTEAAVDDEVIDQGLAIVRRLWDAGLAHRDIKPANLVVQEDRVRVIDVAFAAMRPTPWRQAVDLANMMLTLALRSTPERVYERARRLFSPEEIAEAFAASRSVTVPSQLRSLLRADGRGLHSRLAALGPPRAPVAIQRWSVRRVALTLSVVAGAAVGVLLLLANLRLAGLL